MTSYEVFNSIQVDGEEPQHDYDCVDDCIEASTSDEAISIAQDIVCSRAHAAGYQAQVIDDGMIRITPGEGAEDKPFICFNFHVI